MAWPVRITLLMVLAFALGACGSNIRRDFGGGGSDAAAMILRDRPAVEISIWEGAVVFDLRDYTAWAQGHIPGARLTTVQDLRDGRGLPEDKEAPVLFMGEGPTDSRPEMAAYEAMERGYTNVQVYPGGWRNWIGHKSVSE
ncbi:MAG: rhodanese-like domain-containing protein [Planctomycetes bacterium]|nr:rhodanese-like domain-containing protein [Planctomycetota bacterium]